MSDPRNDAFARGALLFDSGAFFEAHEAWEEGWRVETNETHRRLFQGLIQVAAAFHKLVVVGSADAASRLFVKGLAKLDACPAQAGRESVATFRDRVHVCARALAAGCFDLGHIPKVGRERSMMTPPRDEAELVARAHALCGGSVEALAEHWGVPVGGARVSTKGKVGDLLERALGATGGSVATWDFPALRVELKTIPLDRRGAPRESTFVCTVSLLDAEHAEWATSWARAKLSRVLWVPIEMRADGSRRIAEARLWSPSEEQDRVLAGDFEEILGRIGAGHVERVSGRVGRWLQLRPKAAHGRVRTAAPGADGDLVATVPRGFYLRARFTGAILRDAAALPE